MCKHLSIALTVVSLILFQTQANALTLDKIDIHGYLSFEYENNINGDLEGDVNGSFDMDLFDLVINIRATDKLRIAADLTWEHGTATEDNRGNAAVEYAFAEYSQADWLRYRAGKMFTTFGIYNEIHTAKPATLTVKEPLSTNKNNKFGSTVRFYPRWISGIALQGDVKLSGMHLDYDFQLSNGETEEANHNPFEVDDNTHKAVNGRVRVKPNEDIRLGFSFYTDSMEDSASTQRLDILSYGLQFEWEMDNNIGLEIEYVMGKEDRKATNSVDRFAYNVMLYYYMTPSITPYFRYEYLEPDTDIDTDTATLNILGINLLIDTNMYIKLELDQFSTGLNNIEYFGSDWTEFKASLSIGF